MSIVIGLLRAKIAAVLLGPGGVGLIGLLQSLYLASAAVMCLGLNSVGPRQLAESAASGDLRKLAEIRRALSWGGIGLGLIGGAVVWLLREPIAYHALGDARRAGAVGWVALALGFAVFAVPQTALLAGTGRIGDLARVNIWSSVAATVVGVGALLAFGSRGIPAYVLAVPLATFVFGQVYVSRLPKPHPTPASLSSLTQRWRLFAWQGIPLMFAGLAAPAAQLASRSLVERHLGAVALGCFQAASTISFTYIIFAMSAINAEYYPRLSAAMRDHNTVNRMANEQIEVALLLTGPIFLSMLGLAPWVISLLYSGRFVDAASVFRWQILADILRVTAWPASLILMAAGDGLVFFLIELVASCLLVLATFWLIPVYGLAGAGMATLVTYCAYLPLVGILAWRRTRFLWRPSIARHAAVLMGLAVIVLVTLHVNMWLALLIDGVATIGLTALAARRLAPAVLGDQLSLADLRNAVLRGIRRR